jgi:hypothetical protein
MTGVMTREAASARVLGPASAPSSAAAVAGAEVRLHSRQAAPMVERLTALSAEARALLEDFQGGRPGADAARQAALLRACLDDLARDAQTLLAALPR